MATRWLIDGFNALHQLFGQKELSHDLAGAMNHLLQKIQQDQPQRPNQTTVIFDGKRPGSIRKGSLKVHFSGSQSADDLIVQRIQKSGRSDQWTVFTNDRQLKQRVRSEGHRTQSIASLLVIRQSRSNTSKSATPPHKDPDVSLSDKEAKRIADLWNLRDRLESDS
jgi:predicted RNA-binding protein with PIN domain